MSEIIKPLPKSERIDALDILRGFALFGVLLVNLTMMHTSLYGIIASPTTLPEMLILYFAQGKFYTIFSFLFGLGFYFFLKKSGEHQVRTYKKRLYALLMFGALHMIFIWYGDILFSYAICGFILLWQRKKSDKRLIKTACLLIILVALVIGLSSGFQVSLSNDLEYTSNMATSMASADTAYTSLPYFEFVRFRLTNEIPIVLGNLIVTIPKLMALFYIGLWVGRKEVFQNLHLYKKTLSKLTVFGLVSFLVVIGLHYIIENQLPLNFYTAFATGFLMEVTTVLGSLFYISLVLSVILRSNFLHSLRHVGRMALTNYLVQTIFFTTLINGYGFGWYGKINPHYFLPIAVVFFLVQGVFSAWWLSSHPYGPMEKIWRKLTYGKAV